MDINDLDLLFNSPKDYLLKYFDELRSEINSHYNKQCEAKLADEVKQKLDENLKKLMEKIKSYETECLENVSSNKYDAKQTDESGQILNLIHSKIDYFTVKFSYDETDNQEEEQDEAEYTAMEQEITDLIYKEIAKLEQIVLLNKTMLFVEENDCKISNLFEQMDYLTTVGKLLFFTDQYFSRECLFVVTK